MPLPSDPRVDAGRLWDELERLATFSSTPAPSVTRILFTEADLAGREYVRELMRDAGLDIVEDAAGNIVGRWPGTDPDAGRVGTGSHCDAIPHAGKYDGTVGVLGGIAAVRALREAGFEPRRSIDIIMFTSEEPTRFGIGCSGSRLLGGAVTADALAALTDGDGVSFDAARRSAGYDGDLATVPLAEGDYAAFVELHVEQGPVLEREGVAIGAVTAIAAPASFHVRFEGDGGHAGTVLMPDRRDALVPAAELVVLAERLARDSASEDTVATVGMVDVHPGAVNSIPRRVKLSFDVRDTDQRVRDGVVDALMDRARALAEARDLTCEIEVINSDPPAAASDTIVAAVEQAADAEGVSCQRQVSRAYHDALFMARVAPMGMIFVPSKNGVSHRPDEYTAPEQIAAGVAVLARTLASLAD